MINNSVLSKHHFRIWRIINMIIVVIDVIIPWGLLTEICRNGDHCSGWFSPGTLASQVLVDKAYLLAADFSMFTVIALWTYYLLLNIAPLFATKSITWKNLLVINLLIASMFVFSTFSLFRDVPAVLDGSVAGYWVLLFGLLSCGMLEWLQYQRVNGSVK